MLVYSQLFNPDKCHMVWTWPVYIIVSMAYAPLFYLFTIELANLKGITLKDTVVFIPMVTITALFLIVYLGASHDSLQRIHNSVILNESSLLNNDSKLTIMGYTCYHMARTVAFWFEAGVLLWCCWFLYKSLTSQMKREEETAIIGEENRPEGA